MGGAAHNTLCPVWRRRFDAENTAVGFEPVCHRRNITPGLTGDMIA
jgi:hypothetical protein